MKKYLQRTALVGVAVLLIIGYVIYRHNTQDITCERGMTGKCLPASMCVAPNDAVVSCEDLKQNPTKTDWP